jgi:hypothetical protein
MSRRRRSGFKKIAGDVVEPSALHSWLGVALRSLKYQVTHTFSMGARCLSGFVDALHPHQTALAWAWASAVGMPVLYSRDGTYPRSQSPTTRLESFRSFPIFTERRRPNATRSRTCFSPTYETVGVDRPPSGLVGSNTRGEFSHIGRRARKHAGSSENTKRRRRRSKRFAVCHYLF